MKTKLLLTFALFAFLTSFAKDVDVTTAMNVAKNFYSQKATVSNSINKQNLNLSLAYQCKSKSEGENLYYIFNINTNDGFVIVTGDDVVLPVLGYSDKGTYNGSNMPPALVKWMDGYKQQIIFAKVNNVEATDEIKVKWTELVNGKINNQPRTASTTSVNPLLTTTWDQGNNGGGYNALCPYNYLEFTHTVTGCVATAMAQIMKFWNYPTQGVGFNSYDCPFYGTQSADFASTTYNWSNMPLNTGNNDVALLMYQCGVSVDMNYGVGGSSAFVLSSENLANPPYCAQYAYQTFFGYNPSTIQGVNRPAYSDADWINLLENELDNGRPIQYVGTDANGGHTWVCDGYDSNNELHMNWGWGGIDNGFYELNILNTALGGNDNGDFSGSATQEALIGIQPAPASAPVNIEMYSSIAVTPTPINFYQSFTVNADIYNGGSSDFNGDYCAALFDSEGNFITYIETFTTGANPLPPGYDYSGGLTFSDSDLLTVPGNYTIGIYYAPTGGNWSLAATNGYINPISVQISSPSNPLEIYSDISASPTTFVQGQPGSVNVNIFNNNSYTYYGTYEAALYDLDGNFVETIGSYDETTGLPSGYDYLSPYIAFSSGAITADPGTYILAIVEEESGDNTWYYAGGDYFPNPVSIDVVAPVLSPDIYEADNTTATAYNLHLNWTSNTANPQTSGSNIDNPSDIDYYKITLSSGYSYIITGRVDDSYDSNNSNTYTCDVILSDSVSGSEWSDAYDPSLPGSIILNGAGTVTFLVAPYFPGETGTYLLDINITRTPTTGINELSDNNKLLEIYPNPTRNNITVKNLSSNSFEQLRIVNCLGQIVSEIKMTALLTNQNIDVSNLPNGVYCLEAEDNNNKYSTRFIIER